MTTQERKLTTAERLAEYIKALDAKIKRIDIERASEDLRPKTTFISFFNVEV